MASNINTNDIDTEFPVPGQDNDSQGFRDNFTTIKTNFVAAKAEIEQLQTNTLKLNQDNTFPDSEDPFTVINANLQGSTEALFVGGSVGGTSPTIPINFTLGNYHTFTLNSDTTFSITGFKNGRLCSMKIELRGIDNSPKTVSFVRPSGSIFYDDQSSIFWDNPSINSSSDPHIIEFWSTDGGLTVYAKYLGQFTS